METYIRKVTVYKNQYRVTLPRALMREAGLGSAEVVIMSMGPPGVIRIEEYRGKAKEKARGKEHTVKSG